jgi:hypothetical protein
MLAQEEVHRWTGLVHGSIQVLPLALHFDVGLVDTPGMTHRAGILAPALFEHRNELQHPAHDRGMSHGEPALSHHLHKVPVAEFVADIPAHAQGDDEPVEVTAFEQVVGEGHRHGANCRPVSLLAPEPLGYMQAKQGKFKVNPKGNVTYTLTAMSVEGETDEKSITVTDATPTLSPRPTIVIQKVTTQINENIFIKIFRFLLGNT